MSNKTQELADRLRLNFSRPMSPEEEAFLRDIQAAIEFAIRNGLSFPIIGSTLCQDLNEIARDGFDLGYAKSRGFHPKVTGFCQLTPEDFGEPDEIG